jgi:hypothetical protein
MRVSAPIRLGALAGLLALGSCLADPLGSGTLLLTTPGLASSSVLSGAPGELVPQPIIVRAVAEDGHPVVGAAVQWTALGTNARVENAAGFTGPDGSAVAFWVLGTVATDTQQLTIRVRTPGHAASLALNADAVPDTVASLRFAAGTTSVKLDDSASLHLQAVDPYGNLFLPAGVRFTVGDSLVARVNEQGHVIGRARGYTGVVASAGAVRDTAWVRVYQTVVAISVGADTLTFHSVGQTRLLSANLIDDHGMPVRDSLPDVRVGDTAVAQVQATDSALVVRAVANGSTVVVLRGGSDSTVVLVRVAQRVARIAADSDTLRFTALGETIPVPAHPVDSLGHPVDAVPVSIVVSDTSILAVDSLSVRAKRTGVANVQLVAGGMESNQVALVGQVPDRIEVAFADSTPIQSVVLDSLIPVSCRILDRNGFAIPGDPAVAPSGAGRWSGSSCQTLRIRSSGFDTLRITSTAVSATLPVVLAVRPIVGPVAPLVVDSLPANTAPWAPSARRNSQGQVEVYFAGYSTVADSTGHQPADLYRLLSDDGQHFRYDGVVLTHDPNYCDPNGSGIENIDIVPRADGPGWRMFYSGGSFDCYGWQVFSAVSMDERAWTKEAGVRVSNGGPQPPNPPGAAPWPAGEGMVTDQLPDGTWRMTVGAYEPLTPSQDKFQITEWRSPDQLTWTYVRSLVTTRQLPPEGQRSAYSPTLSEVVPGLWRMFFTADNLNQSGGRSRLWSAVSTDRVNWSVEGEILGGPGFNYLYSALVGGRLFTLQAPQGPLVNSTTLVSVTVQMP